MKVISDIDYEKVATLIKRNNIVAIYQGKDEGGPRALGNRSFLFNPSTDGMNHTINRMKGREWYRPVAASVLHENFHQWFNANHINESPFMVYAVPVKEDSVEKISPIVHENNTCRIQTVKSSDNYHYYNLIKAYHKLTGVPIIGNTSFNLGGKPIINTLKQALDTIQNSKFEYLYLPEKKTLIYAENKE